MHFLLGQLYNIQNDRFLAIREFTIALNLDPKRKLPNPRSYGDVKRVITFGDSNANEGDHCSYPFELCAPAL